MVKALRVRHPPDLPVEKAMPVKKYRGQRQEADHAQKSQKPLRRSHITVDINKPAITQRHKRRPHIFHRHRCHGRLHRSGSQLQQIAHILHQRTAHNDNQQFLLLGPVSVQQKEQRQSCQKHAKAFQYYNVIYHTASLYNPTAVNRGFRILKIHYYSFRFMSRNRGLCFRQIIRFNASCRPGACLAPDIRSRTTLLE